MHCIYLTIREVCMLKFGYSLYKVKSVQRRLEERIEVLYQSMLSRAFAGEL